MKVQGKFDSPEGETFLFFQSEGKIHAIVRDSLGHTIGEGTLIERYVADGNIHSLSREETLQKTIDRICSRHLGFRLVDHYVHITCGGFGGGNGPSTPEEKERSYRNVAEKVTESVPRIRMTTDPERREALLDEFARRIKYLLDLDPLQPFAYQMVLEVNPKNQEFTWKLADCYLKRGEKEEAIRTAKKAVAIRPSFDDFFELGLLCTQCEDFQEALYAWDEALNLNREHPEAYLRRGIANRKLGYYTSACLDFDKAIRYKKQFPKAYYHRGIAKEQLGELTEAIADFRKAMQMEPGKELYKAAHQRALEEKETGLKFDWEAAGSSHDVGRLERRVDQLEIRMDRVEEELEELKSLAKEFRSLTEDKKVDLLQRLTIQAQSDDERAKLKAKQVAHFVLKEHENVISLSTRVSQAARILGTVVGGAILTAI